MISDKSDKKNRIQDDVLRSDGFVASAKRKLPSALHAMAAFAVVALLGLPSSPVSTVGGKVHADVQSYDPSTGADCHLESADACMDNQHDEHPEGCRANMGAISILAFTASKATAGPASWALHAIGAASGYVGLTHCDD